MAGRHKEWQKVAGDSPLLSGASSVPTVPISGTLKLLPFESLVEWADFESLLWRVLYDVEGLRDVYMYGLPGQAQLGLDVIGQAPDNTWVAVQSKREKNFGPQKIQNAVDAFRKKAHPFVVSKFVIGVSREIRSTPAINKIATLKTELEPIEFVVWDKRKLSVMLRHHPAIVREYFGEAVAENFCTPWVSSKISVPTTDAVAIRDALARTPEVSTGAAKLIANAQKILETDPAAALDIVEDAQEKLVKAGFAAHAAQHEALRASALLKLGRGEEGTRRRLDELWEALDLGLSTNAGVVHQGIRSLVSEVGSDTAKEHLAAADRAMSLYVNPLAAVPDWDATQVGSPIDRARLALLAGETALADSNQDWLEKNAKNFLAAANTLDETDDAELLLQVRLRILGSEGSGDWTPVLRDARTGKLGQAMGGLVAARHARHSALQQEFELAEASWDEATQCACLAGSWSDAANWTLSRRVFRTRWKPFTTNELLPLQTALSTYGPGRRVVPHSEDAVESAYAQLADGQARSASIAAQRALRDAVTLGDWAGERSARRVLADVLKESEEPARAAEHLVRVGAVNAVKRLAADQPNNYLDVAALLDDTPYWIAGTAYRLIAAQADLVPDNAVVAIGDRILGELDDLRNGRLVDLLGFAESRFQGAIAALGGLAGRMTEDQADRALAFFEAQDPVEPDHYRYHDDDEAAATAAIVTNHPKLATRALAHLITLLGRADGSRKSQTVDPIIDRIDEARPQLSDLADKGNNWARELLAAEDPTQIEDEVAKDALVRLTTPLSHVPGVIHGGGAGASITDSILVGNLPVGDQESALEQLIKRADDPNVMSSDRSSYLIAAANLAPQIESSARNEYLERALRLVVEPTPSVADEVTGGHTHPLGSFRMALANNSGGQAVFLAAALARGPEEKERVRDAAFGLIGDESVAEYWVTRALQRLGDALAGDIGFLSGQGPALKSLAAILWSKTTTPAPVGLRLAADADVQVRRALARALADRPTDRMTESENLREQVVTHLAQDPCYSVRKPLLASSPAS